MTPGAPETGTARRSGYGSTFSYCPTARFALPRPEEVDADNHQPDAQSYPHTLCAPAVAEAQDPACRNPDEPIGDQVYYGGRVGIAHAAQSACRDHLCAVEQLEGGRDGEQAGARGDDP